MRYISDDNKVFETEQDCLAHENGLRAAEAKKKQLDEEKKSRRDKVAESYRNFVKEYNQYKKDYSEQITFTGRDGDITDWINAMLRF